MAIRRGFIKRSDTTNWVKWVEREGIKRQRAWKGRGKIRGIRWLLHIKWVHISQELLGSL